MIQNHVVQMICETPLEDLIPEARALIPRLIHVIKAANKLDIDAIVVALDRLGAEYAPPDRQDVDDHYKAYAEKLDQMTLNRLLKIREAFSLQAEHVPDLNKYLKEVNKAVERHRLGPVVED